MKLRVKGNRAVIKGLDLANRRVESVVKNNLRDWAIDTESVAKSRVPVDTGALKNSINADTANEGFTWKVGTNISYAPYVEFGTGAFVDVPAGLERYASDFKCKGIKEVNLPARAYLFNSAREEFFKMMQNLKKDLDKMK